MSLQKKGKIIKTIKNIAIVGATGAVGLEMIKVLEQRNFPVKNIKLLASERSEGRVQNFKGNDLPVQRLQKSSFKNIDIALFSAGGAISKRFAKLAVESGAVVVDNTSAFRMNPNVPLIVPEVNPNKISVHEGIIANPNCSTIQLVVVLKPIHTIARIKRVVVTTFQSVSGAGLKASEELRRESEAILSGEEYKRSVFPHQIAFNCLPQIPQTDAFLPNGYSKEEMKMVNETKKILDDDSIKITATTVRVPVFRGHSESVNVQTERKITRSEVIETLSNSPGVKVMDNAKNQIYPLAPFCEGKDETFVGRIREDISIENGLELWIVSDNLRKGAALNTVQIAELL